MVSSISFGNVNTVGGKTVLSGTASGIDTNALVEALTKAKQLPATQMQDKITANQTKISALQTLKAALQNLQKSVDALRNPTFGSATTNAFSARQPFLSVTNGKTVSDFVGVSTGNGAPIGKYTLEVNELATAEVRQSGTFASRTASIVGAAGSNTDGGATNVFAAGTFQINGVNVTINQGDNLNNIAAAINSVSSTSKVTANIVKFSDTDFRLVLTGKDTGDAADITITDNDHVLPFSTVPSDHQTMFTITQPAQDAELEFNGETIIRSTNKISDLIENVTFSLYGKTNGETITLDIDKNNSSIASSIGQFVDSYNVIRTFQAQQQQRDVSGKLVDTAVLNNNSTLNTVMNQLSVLISGQASIGIPSLYGSGSQTAPLRLGDLGITLGNIAAGIDEEGNATPAITNTLEIDAAKLNSALESYFDNTSNIFQFNFLASSPNLGIYKRSNTVTDSNFSIQVDTTQSIGNQAKIVGIDGSTLSSPIALEYKTTTTMKSLSFTNKDISSYVNASGTDTPGQFAAGTFQINGANVTLTPSMTLTGVMTAINAASGTSGVTASIVKNGTDDFSIVMTGTANGTTGIVITDPDSVLPSTGMFTTTKDIPVISAPANSPVKGFTTTYTGDGTDIISRPGSISNKDITIEVDTGQLAGEQVKVTKIFGATLATPIYMDYTNSGGSSTISGKSGTPFAGLQMIYTGDGTDTINISMSQGIADKMYNSIDNVLNGQSGIFGAIGMIDEAITNLQNIDTSLQKSIDNINSQVETFREQLLNKFAALEAAITASNQLLELLSAQTNAALVASGR